MAAVLVGEAAAEQEDVTVGAAVAVVAWVAADKEAASSVALQEGAAACEARLQVREAAGLAAEEQAVAAMEAVAPAWEVMAAAGAAAAAMVAVATEQAQRVA